MNKEVKVGFFQEEEGVNSSIRLYSFISLIAGILYISAVTLTGKLDVNSISVFFGLLIGAFAPKVISKYAEKQ